VPCNCSGHGIAADQLDSDVGHCVMNDEIAASLPGMVNVFVPLTNFRFTGVENGSGVRRSRSTYDDVKFRFRLLVELWFLRHRRTD